MFSNYLLILNFVGFRRGPGFTRTSSGHSTCQKFEMPSKFRRPNYPTLGPRVDDHSRRRNPMVHKRKKSTFSVYYMEDKHELRVQHFGVFVSMEEGCDDILCFFHIETD